MKNTMRPLPGARGWEGPRGWIREMARGIPIKPRSSVLKGRQTANFLTTFMLQSASNRTLLTSILSFRNRHWLSCIRRFSCSLITASMFSNSDDRRTPCSHASEQPGFSSHHARMEPSMRSRSISSTVGKVFTTLLILRPHRKRTDGECSESGRRPKERLGEGGLRESL